MNDPDTGLIQMQQRYYDPIAGRFLSVDPITTDEETGDSFNRYKYASNNPFRFTDPDGQQDIDNPIPQVPPLPIPVPLPIPLPIPIPLPAPIPLPLPVPVQTITITGVKLPSAVTTWMLPTFPGIVMTGVQVIMAAQTGKNDQHVSQDRKNRAKEKLEEERQKLAALRSKPNKTKEDKEALRKLEGQVRHLQGKADDTGENHSMKDK